jgi:hypothetical protein
MEEAVPQLTELNDRDKELLQKFRKHREENPHEMDYEKIVCEVLDDYQLVVSSRGLRACIEILYARCDDVYSIYDEVTQYDVQAIFRANFKNETRFGFIEAQWGPSCNLCQDHKLLWCTPEMYLQASLYDLLVNNVPSCVYSSVIPDSLIDD